MSGNTQVEALLGLIITAAHDAVAQYGKNGQDVPSLDSTDQSSLSTMSGDLPLKRALRLLEGACDQLCATLAPPAHTVINRVRLYDAPCMRVAKETRVADALLANPNGLHVSELAKLVNLDEGKLAHILRLLGTKHCFREVDTDVFANNRLSLVLLSSNAVSDLVSLNATEIARGGSTLLETMTDPGYAFSYDPTKSPFMYAVRNEGIEGTFFNWMIAHPDRRENFGRAMIGLDEVMSFNAVLEHFPWVEASTICDVGSGVGAFTLPLVQMYPHVKVTLHDLPETLSQAEDIWLATCPEAIANARVEFSPLNFFEEVPAKGQDIYYLRNILHNWPDERAKIILRQVQQAMQPHSRLLIHDYVLQHLHRTQGTSDSDVGVEVAPEPLLPNFGAGNSRMYNQDLAMLFSYNAKERTLRDSMELANGVGLRLVKVWDFAEASVLELRLA